MFSNTKSMQLEKRMIFKSQKTLKIGAEFL